MFVNFFMTFVYDELSGYLGRYYVNYNYLYCNKSHFYTTGMNITGMHTVL